MWEKRCTRQGQPDLTRVALEQLRAKLSLQDLDPLRESGLGDVQRHRRPTKVAMISHCEKCSYVPKLYVRRHFRMQLPTAFRMSAFPA